VRSTSNRKFLEVPADFRLRKSSGPSAARPFPVPAAATTLTGNCYACSLVPGPGIADCKAGALLLIRRSLETTPGGGAHNCPRQLCADNPAEAICLRQIACNGQARARVNAKHSHGRAAAGARARDCSGKPTGFALANPRTCSGKPGFFGRA
jgi:hypothetical protein